MKRSPSYSEANDKVTEMNTLTACLNKAMSDGYTESFEVAERGLYAQSRADKFYKPEEISIPNFYRFEGDTDPGDMSILYVIETVDGVKGTLVDAYGTYSDGTVNKFMRQVEDIHKRVDKNYKPKEIKDAPPEI